MLKVLITGIVGLGLCLGSILGLDYLSKPSVQPPTVGSYSPTGGGTYRLGQSIGTSDTTIRLSSFKEPVSNIPYTMSYLNSDIEYGTLSPQSSVSEFISFSGITQNTDGSATLTGVIRGLSRTPGTGGCVASTTLAQSHAGQSILILSNPPCQLAEYTPLRTTATSTGILIFSSTTPPRYDANYTASGNQLVSFAQLAATAFNGAPTSTFSGMGIVQLPSSVQVASSTASSTTGAPMPLITKYSTTTPGTLCNSGIWNCTPVAQVSGFLSQAWQDLTQTWIFSSSTSNSFLSTNASTTNFSISNLFKFATASGSSSVLSVDANGYVTANAPKVTTLGVSGAGTLNTSAASTTQFTVTIPANSLKTTSTIDVSMQTVFIAGNCAYEIQIGTGLASTSLADIENQDALVTGTIVATSSSAQSSKFIASNLGGGVYNAAIQSTFGYIAFAGYSNASQLYLAFIDRAIGSGSCKTVGPTVRLSSN